jgi:hypothetical protein
MIRGENRHRMFLDLCDLIAALKQLEAPSDTEFVRDVHPRAAKSTSNFIGGMLTKESEVKGMENLVRAMELNRNGEDVCLHMAPHEGALDPVFLKILLERTAHGNGDEKEKAVAKETIEKLIVVIGQRVMLSRFRRVFASAVRSLFTIPPKYRDQTEEDEKVLVQVHSEVVGKLMEHMRTSANHLLLVCPETGFTRRNKVGFPPTVGTIPKSQYVVPVGVKTVPNFLNPNSGKKMVKNPSPVLIGVGEPFRLEETVGISNRASEYVAKFHNSLLEVLGEEVVGQYKWGIKKRKRSKNPNPNAPIPEIFTPVDMSKRSA